MHKCPGVMELDFIFGRKHWKSPLHLLVQVVFWPQYAREASMNLGSWKWEYWTNHRCKWISHILTYASTHRKPQHLLTVHSSMSMHWPSSLPGCMMHSNPAWHSQFLWCKTCRQLRNERLSTHLTSPFSVCTWTVVCATPSTTPVTIGLDRLSPVNYHVSFF